MEVCYALLNGELPNAEQKAEFVQEIKARAEEPEQLKAVFDGFTRDAHPMGMLLGALGALSTYHHEGLDINNAEHRKQVALNLAAKLLTFAAMCYKHSIGEDFVAPIAEICHAENV